MRLPPRTTLRHSVRRCGRAFAALLAVCLAPVAAYPAPAQTPAAPATDTLRSSATLVFVPALVETPAKDIVYTLTASDFVLTDNGVPQKVFLEEDQSNASRPLALVVLMQIGGDARKHFANYAHLDAMLEAVVGEAPNKIAIVNFDSQPEYDSPFVSGIAQWGEEVDHPHQGDGGAAIFDALAYALDMLKQHPPGTRRAILLISQQHDQHSKTSAEEIIRTVGETNTAVYALTYSVEKSTLKQGLYDLTHNDKPMILNPPPMNPLAPLMLAAEASRKNFAAEIANRSGGEPFDFGSKVEFDRALNTVRNHIRNGYTLSFRPTSSEPGLHTLKLRIVDHPELLIDARTSYWSDPAGPSEKTE